MDEDVKLLEKTVEDLPLDTQQAEQTKGGIDPQGRLLVGTEGGIWREKPSLPSSLK